MKNLFILLVLAASQSASADQKVLFFKSQITATGNGRFSEQAIKMREAAYKDQLADFRKKCHSEVEPVTWKPEVRVAHRRNTYLNEEKRMWYSSDRGYLYCYGLTHF